MPQTLLGLAGRPTALGPALGAQAPAGSRRARLARARGPEPCSAAQQEGGAGSRRSTPGAEPRGMSRAVGEHGGAGPDHVSRSPVVPPEPGSASATTVSTRDAETSPSSCAPGLSTGCGRSGAGSSSRSGASRGVSQPRADDGWDEWQAALAATHTLAAAAEDARVALEGAASVGAYAAAGALRHRATRLSTADALGCALCELSNAVVEEDYGRAAALRDRAWTGLPGWWAGKAHDSEGVASAAPGVPTQAMGHLIHVTRAYGHYTARAYTGRELAAALGWVAEPSPADWTASTAVPGGGPGGGGLHAELPAVPGIVQAPAAPVLEVHFRHGDAGLEAQAFAVLAPPPPPPAVAAGSGAGVQHPASPPSLGPGYFEAGGRGREEEEDEEEEDGLQTSSSSEEGDEDDDDTVAAASRPRHGWASEARGLGGWRAGADVAQSRSASLLDYEDEEDSDGIGSGAVEAWQRPGSGLAPSRSDVLWVHGRPHSRTELVATLERLLLAAAAKSRDTAAALSPVGQGSLLASRLPGAESVAPSRTTGGGDALLSTQYSQLVGLLERTRLALQALDREIDGGAAAVPRGGPGTDEDVGRTTPPSSAAGATGIDPGALAAMHLHLERLMLTLEGTMADLAVELGADGAEPHTGWGGASGIGQTAYDSSGVVLAYDDEQQRHLEALQSAWPRGAPEPPTGVHAVGGGPPDGAPRVPARLRWLGRDEFSVSVRGRDVERTVGEWVARRDRAAVELGPADDAAYPAAAAHGDAPGPDAAKHPNEPGSLDGTEAAVRLARAVESVLEAVAEQLRQRQHEPPSGEEGESDEDPGIKRRSPLDALDDEVWSLLETALHVARAKRGEPAGDRATPGPGDSNSRGLLPAPPSHKAGADGVPARTPPVYTFHASPPHHTVAAISRGNEEDEEDSISFRRVKGPRGSPLPPALTDPLAGVYLGHFGPHGPEVVLLEVSMHDGERWARMTKITGDRTVPAGELSFEGRIGRTHALAPPAEGYPPELGVTARYAGRGRVAEMGYRNPRWVPAELLLFAPGNPATRQAQLGVVFAISRSQRYLVLFNRVDLDALEGRG